MRNENNDVVNLRSFQLFIRNYEAVMDGFMLDDQEGLSWFGIKNFVLTLSSF